ncbi:MAG: flagellar type III secretion system protein FliR [Parvibaculum sp.]|uniref:flagellar biosynthetic protein FliR n=1 Tax=Parvibaculum sp. TaxID=2024848 RepID=UPI0025EEE670|nr:flagellar biosynthetic protein FliR [Parvibaculum sp.]MCE9650671.1 flagellar type III secretion system protein FliR [Parvibaculum sp.]
MISIEFLPQTGFVFMLVFSRLGAMIMLMPAIGEIAVPTRIRLILALILSAIMMPLVSDTYSAIPLTVPGLALAVVYEILIGIFIGMSAQIVMSSLHVAGNIIALQTGLAFAQNVDPTQGTQSAIVASFLSMLAVTLIFATDLHHLLIAAMRDSYVLFKPGEILPVGDFLQMAVKAVSGAFVLGVQLSAPFVVFGLVFYIGLGLLSKLMPQIQIFFIAMPANIGLGFALLFLILGAMMTWFLQGFEQSLSVFVH